MTESAQRYRSRAPECAEERELFGATLGTLGRQRAVHGLDDVVPFAERAQRLLHAGDQWSDPNA